MRPLRLLPWLLSALLLGPIPAGAVRVKDIATVEGIRPNQLIGYGLVVGLNGTGDKETTIFTNQSLSSMLQRLGITVDSTAVKVKNVAAVMVTATLPPFARAGTRVDVLLSSLGDAKSLEGGTLVLTPLRAPDGQVYAVAQGPVSIGGFAASGEAASVTKGHPTVGAVPGGGLIEREMALDLSHRDTVSILLRAPDFTTAHRLVQVINSRLDRAAHALDAGTVRVAVPEGYRTNLVEFLAAIEALEVVPDAVAKVVINERTGTVVLGEQVRISTVAISHGTLSVTVKEDKQVSQPPPLSSVGQTVVVPDTKLEVKERQEKLVVVPAGTSLGEVVRALNAIGVSPRELIVILQAIKAAGALQAALEIL